MRPIVTILDDYQGVALTTADWSSVQEHYDVRVVRTHLSGRPLLDALGESEIVVAMRERTELDKAVLEQLPALRLIVTTGMSNSAIDVDEARSRGIVVSGTATGSIASVPELTIGMMIALGRNFVTEHLNVAHGRWQTELGIGLSGRTLGLIGLGRLGGGTARLARAFGMNVVAWSPHLTTSRAAEHDVVAVERDEVFTRSDYVSIHVRLTPETIGIVGERDLRSMKPTAYLINTSRGPLVDEPALLRALNEKWIGGVGLDVYDEEPLSVDHPLRSAPRTLLLPHVGYVTEESYRTCYSEAAEDVLAYHGGSPVRVIS